MAIINGTEFNDRIAGTAGDDEINGLGGNDWLSGLSGNDRIAGGDGRDNISPGSGDDIVNAGDGNDVVYLPTTSVGLKTLDGNLGIDWLQLYLADKSTLTVSLSDNSLTLPDRLTARNFESFRITGSSNNDIISGGSRKDILIGGAGNDRLIGNGGNDILYPGAENDIADGGLGNDIVYCENTTGNQRLEGGAGSDQLVIRLNHFLWNGDFNFTYSGNVYRLTSSTATITATNFERASVSTSNGNDQLIGGDSDDFLNAGGGNNIVDGGAGNDVLTAGNGNDSFYGGAGNDEIQIGSGGNDFVNAGEGNDLVQTIVQRFPNTIQVIDGGAGIDTLSFLVFSMGELELTVSNGGITIPDMLNASNFENFKIFVDGGYAVITAGGGNDEISSFDGDSQLIGKGGDDVLLSDYGIDILSGGNGVDRLSAGEANDRLGGGAGDDVLTGGSGNDWFLYKGNSAYQDTLFGLDTIQDFTVNSDRLVLSKTVFLQLTSPIRSGLNSSDFAVVTSDESAALSQAAIVYNSQTGGIFYNANGDETGLGSGSQFIILATRPNLTAADFTIVA